MKEFCNLGRSAKLESDIGKLSHIPVCKVQEEAM